MKSKREEEHFDKDQKTDMILVPVFDGTNMSKLRKAIKGFSEEEMQEKGGQPRCEAEGKPCDAILGISWCNGRMPAPKLDLQIRFEYSTKDLF